MGYELYYWPSIPGRGEFVRLALEEAGADYLDVARHPGSRTHGVSAMMRLMQGSALTHLPFAPPFLKAGRLLIAQTTNILLFLGSHHGLAPSSEAGRLWANQLQLTISDWLDEVHDTHHPVSSALYYEQQKPEAKRRAAAFVSERLPKFLGYFEQILARNSSGHYLLGRPVSYVDLSMFQMIAGLRYAFPRTMAKLERKHSRLKALHGRVAARPRIKAYLSSERRIAFNQQGIFRHYPELDA